MISRLHDPAARGFASDNYAGVHPEILSALTVANDGHQTAYGDDVYTERLQEVFHRHFGEQAQAYPVCNGTGANVIALQSLATRWDAVICADTAHITVDEGAAPEKVGGLKLLTVPTSDGKLTAELIDREAWGWGDEHRAQPNIVSLTQATELGTNYTINELRTICAHAHDRGMRVHMDGARLANAAAAMDVPLRALTTDVGVDVLSFGGTKNGLMFGEVVVVLNPDAVGGLSYLRKSAMQLVSKMRFLSSQFIALLEGDLWLRNARHANAMAQRLARAVDGLPDVEILRPVQANAVFARLPSESSARLQKRFGFYTRNEHPGDVRWMCSFDTTEADVDRFAQAIVDELA